MGKKRKKEEMSNENVLTACWLLCFFVFKKPFAKKESESIVNEGENLVHQGGGSVQPVRRRNVAGDRRAARVVPIEVQSVLWLGNHDNDADTRRKTIRSRVKEVTWDKEKVLFDDRQLSFGTNIANHIIAMMNWRAELRGREDREEILRDHWDENVKPEVKEIIRSRRHTKQSDVMNKIKSECVCVLSSLVMLICGINRGSDPLPPKGKKGYTMF